MAKQAFTYEQILSDIRKKIYFPIYLLMGEEPYYIDLIADYMQENILDETNREFDQIILYGNDVDMPSIINAAKRYPMMALHQVIIVKEAQQIKKWDDLAFYLQNPQKSSILVFCYKYGQVDKRKAWLKNISEIGVLFESKKVRDYELSNWIKSYAKSKKIDIEEKAIAMLAEFLGTDLSKITNEIDKLLITKPANQSTITPELVEKNIGISKDYNVFELQNALINRDLLKSNRIIRYFANNEKANPLPMVLSQLFSFFSNLMLYHYISDKSKETVASELKINPYFVRDYQKAAQVFNAWKTMHIISYIRETDARSKGVENLTATDGDLMKELIYKILH